MYTHLNSFYQDIAHHFLLSSKIPVPSQEYSVIYTYPLIDGLIFVSFSTSPFRICRKVQYVVTLFNSYNLHIFLIKVNKNVDTNQKSTKKQITYLHFEQ